MKKGFAGALLMFAACASGGALEQGLQAHDDNVNRQIAANLGDKAFEATLYSEADLEYTREAYFSQRSTEERKNLGACLVGVAGSVLIASLTTKPLKDKVEPRHRAS